MLPIDTFARISARRRTQRTRPQSGRHPENPPTVPTALEQDRRLAIVELGEGDFGVGVDKGLLVDAWCSPKRSTLRTSVHRMNFGFLRRRSPASVARERLQVLPTHDRNFRGRPI